MNPSIFLPSAVLLWITLNKAAHSDSRAANQVDCLLYRPTTGSPTEPTSPQVPTNFRFPGCHFSATTTSQGLHQGAYVQERFILCSNKVAKCVALSIRHHGDTPSPPADQLFASGCSRMRHGSGKVSL